MLAANKKSRESGPMSEQIPYGALMHKALRQLLADVLRKVAAEGLPGAHHFFIGFDTNAEGVGLSDRLREKFPEEMTVVMQDWFDDLVVTDHGFAVTLNFSDVPERLEIPFDSITTFVDPSVEFGLRFDAQEDELNGEVPFDLPEEKTDEDNDLPKEGEVVSLDQFRKT